MTELACKLDCASTGGQMLPAHIHVQKVRQLSCTHFIMQEKYKTFNLFNQPEVAI
jgi:hypothetical protein